MKQTKAAGTKRELQEVRLRQQQGFVAFRSPASLGCADVIAMKAYDVASLVLLIEVKANHGSPWKNFGLVKRAALALSAHIAGAQAVLVHWPPHGERREYFESDWPGVLADGQKRRAA